MHVNQTSVLVQYKTAIQIFFVNNIHNAKHTKYLSQKENNSILKIDNTLIEMFKLDEFQKKAQEYLNYYNFNFKLQFNIITNEDTSSTERKETDEDFPHIKFIIKYKDLTIEEIRNIDIIEKLSKDTKVMNILTDIPSISYFKISKGEQQVVNLCLFLAIVETKFNPTGDIFIDDPISSLDDINLSISISILKNFINRIIKNTGRKVIFTTHHTHCFQLLRIQLEDIINQGTYNMLQRQEKNLYTITTAPKNGLLYHIYTFEKLWKKKNLYDKARGTNNPNKKIERENFFRLRIVLDAITSMTGQDIKSILTNIKYKENIEIANSMINDNSHCKKIDKCYLLCNNSETPVLFDILVLIEENYHFLPPSPHS